jgi:predicted DNA-binding transcriptional regulator YafY
MDASDGDRVGDINFVTNSVTDLISLNERQQWLMIRVATGVRCTARDLASHWQVSNRTAKRDIAYLKALGIIQYHGQHRKGRYVEARGS